MRERPIIFDAVSVRGILAGSKTQTRRVVKPHPTGTQRVIEGLAHVTRGMDPADDGRVWYVGDGISPGAPIRCPLGVPGDRLWVRETWADMADGTGCPDDRGSTLYRATDPEWGTEGGLKWRPSLFMRRERSRITLEITEVRVERVQDISETDAIAEGADLKVTTDAGEAGLLFGVRWDAINAKRGFGWRTNPWVWAITFRRLEPTT